MTKENRKRLFSVLGVLVAAGFAGCQQQGQSVPASVEDDKQETARQNPPAADRRCAELVEQTPPLSERGLRIEPVVAEHAMKLVEAGCWKEAASLLEKLNDTDFFVPAHEEVMEVDGNGNALVEFIPPSTVGNRHAALVRCYYHLGRLQDAAPHVWKAIEDARFEPTCFRSIIELNRDDLDTVVDRAKSILADEPHNTAAKKLLEYVELFRLLDAKRFDEAIDTITFGCSCPDGTSLTPKDAFDRLAAETIAQQGDVVVQHLVAKLQSSPGEVHSCIVYALEFCPDERGLRALVTAREGVRNYGMGKRLDQAIERIRQALANAPDSGRIRVQFTAKVISLGENVVGKIPPRPRRVHPTAGALQLDTIASQLLQLEVRVPGTLPKIKTGDRIAFTFGDKSKLFGEGDPAGKTYRFEVDWDWKKEGVLATNLRVVSNKELKATR